jgi:hypothetical protein
LYCTAVAEVTASHPRERDSAHIREAGRTGAPGLPISSHRSPLPHPGLEPSLGSSVGRFNRSMQNHVFYFRTTILIDRIRNIQVQFHDLVDDPGNEMVNIQVTLQKTRHPTYPPRFDWKNWTLNTQG